MERTSIILIFLTLFSTSITSTTVDTIRPDQTLKDGDTIVSTRGEFELGFFSLGSSRNRYVGIWYKRISYGTIVWVANRKSPLTCTSCILRLNRNGTIELTGGTGRTMWSSNSSRSVMNPIAQLLDTGNLVVRDENDNDKERFLWQSFDYPGDTMLPGMKIGLDLAKGLDWSYTSWKSADDPSLGSFAYRFDTNGFPQLFKWKGAMLLSRTDPWVGDQPSGDEVGGQNWIYTPKFVLSKNKI